MEFDIKKFKEQCQTLLTRAEDRIATTKESMEAFLSPENDKFSCEKLADYLIVIATTEGYARIMKEASNASEKWEKQPLILYFARQASNFSNDQWSGRNNDFRRCLDDGKKQAIRDILDLIEYGSCLSL